MVADCEDSSSFEFTSPTVSARKKVPRKYSPVIGSAFFFRHKSILSSCLFTWVIKSSKSRGSAEEGQRPKTHLELNHRISDIIPVHHGILRLVYMKAIVKRAVATAFFLKTLSPERVQKDAVFIIFKQPFIMYFA